MASNTTPFPVASKIIEYPPEASFSMWPTPHLRWNNGVLEQEWEGKSGTWSRAEWRVIPQASGSAIENEKMQAISESMMRRKIKATFGDMYTPPPTTKNGL